MNSGVTRVGVTGGDNWWVSPYYTPWKKSDDFLSHRFWKWRPSLLSSPGHSIFPRRLSSVFFLNSSMKQLTKIILGRVSPPGGCHPGRSPRSLLLVTPLDSKLEKKSPHVIWSDNNDGRLYITCFREVGWERTRSSCQPFSRGSIITSRVNIRYARKRELC